MRGYTINIPSFGINGSSQPFMFSDECVGGRTFGETFGAALELILFLGLFLGFLLGVFGFSFGGC